MSKPTTIQPGEVMSSIVGKYRNGLGVEMEITGIHFGRNIIGTIYEGVIHDNLFGNKLMLVTAEGLADCGYVKIGTPDE